MSERAAAHIYFSDIVNKLKHIKFWGNFLRYLSVGVSILVLSFVAQSVDLQTVTHRDPTLATANFDGEISVDNGFVSSPVSDSITLGENGILTQGAQQAENFTQNSVQSGLDQAPPQAPEQAPQQAPAPGPASAPQLQSKNVSDVTASDVRVHFDSNNGITWTEGIYNESKDFDGGSLPVHFIAYHCMDNKDTWCDGNSPDKMDPLDDKPNDTIQVPARGAGPKISTFNLSKSTDCGTIQVDYALAGDRGLLGGRVFNFGKSCDLPGTPPSVGTPGQGAPAPPVVNSPVVSGPCPILAVPTNLKINGQPSGTTFPASQNEFTLSWDGPEGAEYFVRFDDPRTSKIPDIMPNNDPNAKISSKQFQVTGINDAGNYDWWVHSANGCGASDAVHAALIKAGPSGGTGNPSCPVIVTPDLKFNSDNKSLTWGSQNNIDEASIKLTRDGQALGTWSVAKEQAGKPNNWFTIPNASNAPAGNYAAELTVKNTQVANCPPVTATTSFIIPAVGAGICITPGTPGFITPTVGQKFPSGTKSIKVSWAGASDATSYEVTVNGITHKLGNVFEFSFDAQDNTNYDITLVGVNECGRGVTIKRLVSVGSPTGELAPACISLTASTSSTQMGSQVTLTPQVQDNGNLGTIMLRFNNKAYNLSPEGWTDIATLTSGVPYTYTTPLSTEVGKHWFDILVRDKNGTPVAWWEKGDVCRTSVDLTASATNNLVTITKNNNNTPDVVLGQPATFNISVTNISGKVLSGIQVVDDLPSALTYVTGSTQGITNINPTISSSPLISGSRLTWSNISLGIGGTWNISFKATANQVGVWTNNAYAVAENQNTPQVQATVTVTPIGAAQCTIQTSPNPATGAAPLTVTFSGGFTDGRAVSSYQWDFNDNGTVESTLINPTANFTVAGTYTTRLKIFDASGNPATCTTPVNVTSAGNAALTLQKWVVLNGQDYEVVGQTVHAPFKPDEVVNYRLDITNNSGVAIQNVQIIDTLPNIFTAITPQNGGTVSGNQITWNIPTVAANSGKTSLTYSAKVRSDIGAGTNSHINTATLTGVNSTTGSAIAPLTDTATIFVSKDATAGEPSLTFEKNPSSQRVQAGQPATFTLRVRNTTSRALQNIQVTDELPAGFTYVSNSAVVSGTGSTTAVPTISGQTLGWTISSLDANAEWSVTFRATAPTAAQTYRNNAKAVVGDKTWNAFGDVIVEPAGATLAVVPPATVYAPQVMGVQTLPKTGLPALAWAAAAFIPVGIRLRRFSRSLVDNAINNPNFIWEDRQFKK